MICQRKADAMGLASALMKGITPLDVHHFDYFQRSGCLSNTHWLGPWHWHFDDKLRLCQNIRKPRTESIL